MSDTPGPGRIIAVRDPGGGSYTITITSDAEARLVHAAIACRPGWRAFDPAPLISAGQFLALLSVIAEA